MENQNMLRPSFTTHAWNWFVRGSTKEILFQLRGCVDVNCPRDMTAIILVIKPTVDNLVRGNL
jgi:hypothetical protein